MSKKDARTIEKTLEIAAPPEAVWKTLTDAKELVRWFPLKAEVEPRVGGRIWLSWEGEFEGEHRIEIFEPERHLRTTWNPMTKDEGGPTELSVDYHLEGRGGGTILRLVHSASAEERPGTASTTASTPAGRSSCGVCGTTSSSTPVGTGTPSSWSDRRRGSAARRSGSGSFATASRLRTRGTFPKATVTPSRRGRGRPSSGASSTTSHRGSWRGPSTSSRTGSSASSSSPRAPTSGSAHGRVTPRRSTLQGAVAPDARAGVPLSAGLVGRRLRLKKRIRPGDGGGASPGLPSRGALWLRGVPPGSG